MSFHTNINQSMISSSYDQQMFEQVISLSKTYPENNQQQRKKTSIFNFKGVHDNLQLILVLLLIMVSVGSVTINTNPYNTHIRYMRLYIDEEILGNTRRWVYDNGDNDDQSYIELFFLRDMVSHFSRVLNLTKSYRDDGVANFIQSFPIITLKTQSYDRNYSIYEFGNVEEAFQFFNNFQHQALRKLLLPVEQMEIQINFGSNKFSNHFMIVFQYSFYSYSMITVQLKFDYSPAQDINSGIFTIRLFQQILGSLLSIIYIYRLALIHKKIDDVSRYRNIQRNQEENGIQDFTIIRRRFRNWYISLIFMSIVTVVSAKFAPLCSFLQLLPIFQFPDNKQDAKDFQMYNFNRNLRFSLPLIFSVFLQIYIFLNGFIFYSLLMYPSQYFDNYLQGFFSYYYQLYQVGTYEIFTQIKDKGNLAYFLYAFLYFYVFLVGNSLVPALFCVMIQMKMYQKDIQNFISDLVAECECPNCGQKNTQIITQNIQIFVSSPKVSPLISKKRIKSPKEDQASLMIYIEGEELFSQAQKKLIHENFNISDNSFKYSRKLLSMSRNLQAFIKSIRNQQQKETILSKIIKKRQQLSRENKLN